MTTGGGDKSVSKKWAKFEICGKFFKTKFALFDKKNDTFKRKKSFVAYLHIINGCLLVPSKEQSFLPYLIQSPGV